MSRLPLRCLAFLGLLATVLATVPALLAQATNQPVTHDKIIRYVREHYNIPDSTKITMIEPSETAFPDFLMTTLTVDDGKDKRSEPFYVSKNMRYLIEGDIFNTQAANQGEATEKIIHYVRDHYSIPDSTKITMADLHESIYADFFATMITVDDGKEKRAQPFFISKNMRYLVGGSITNLAGAPPREEIARVISLEDQPTQGPTNAPVTLVEYSDLACPHCALLQERLETEIVPKYGDKLRVVFKEFPLVTIHDWVLAGAVAAQCTYQIDPSQYAAFRSVVFKNQEVVNRENARDMLLHFGAEAGVDNMKLAACIDSRASLSRVEANMLEGEALGISETPTSFINGRVIIGAQPAAEFYKVIDEAMQDTK
jgi:protein-disulfide isomerase